MASMFMVLGINVLSSIALSRGLTPDGKGLYMGITMWSNFVLGFCDVGIYSATVYLWVSQQQYTRRDTFTTMMFWSLCTGGLALIIVELLSWHVLQGHYNAAQSMAAHVYYIVSCTGPISAVLTGVLTAEQRFSLQNFSRVAVPASLTLSWLILFGIGALSIIACLYIGSVISLGSLFPFLWVCRNYLLKPGKIRWRILSTGIWYSLKGYGGSVIGTVSGNANQLIMFSALSPSALAYFQTASSATGVLWTVPNAVGTTSFPQMIGDEVAVLHKRVSTYVRMSVIAILFFGVLLGMSEPFLIPLLFGRAYQPAIIPALLLLPNALFGGLSGLVGNALSSTGRTLHNTVATAVGVGLTLLFMIATIHAWGLVAAALAAVFGTISNLVVRLVWYHWCICKIRFLDLCPKWKDVLEVLLIIRKRTGI